MKVLQVHNRYLSGESGEDAAVEADRELLAERGHDVQQFFGSNAEFGTVRGFRRVKLGASAIWSRGSYAALRELVRRDRPTIAHVHNTFGQLSGSVYWALAAERIPVVQTLHNYRWLCPNSLLLRDGRPCGQCVGRTPYPAILHRCRYNNSFAAAAVIAGSNAVHMTLGSYKAKIHAVIALTAFMESKLDAAGFDSARVHVRPNFLPDPGPSTAGYEARTRQIVFVGLIDAHKGVTMCAQAWDLAKPQGWRLLMVGDGRLRPGLVAEWRAQPSIEWTGRIPRQDALAAILASRFLVLPSLWYEGLPMVLLEAMSQGTPLIVPDHGAFPELVDDGVNGIVFKAGDVGSLRDALRRAATMQREEWETLAHGARARYLERYSTDVAYETLLSVYESAIASSKGANA